ncbi:hypothetical protein ACP4OV_028955 [Aristida adscensionis]
MERAILGSTLSFCTAVPLSYWRSQTWAWKGRGEILPWLF